MSLATITPAALSTFDLIMPAAELAERIARTEFVPAGLRNRPEAVLAAILYGHEAGVGPMEALAKINVIDGRPAFSAELMRAQVLRHGHRLWADEAGTTRVVLCGQRAGDDHIHRITWTMDDARKAGLAGKSSWQKYPRDMLTARATAALCRLAFPDVLGAARYAVEELEDGEQPAAATEIVTAAPSRTRKRAPRIVDIPADTPAEIPERVDDERPPLPDEPLDPDLDDTMTEPQRRKLNALFREAGITQRTDRHTIASALTARTIDTDNQPTATETTYIIAVLDEVVTGRRELVLDDNGNPIGIRPVEHDDA